MAKDKKKVKKVDKYLGKLGRDKITGFQGIIIGKVIYLFGCNQLGLAPSIDKDGKAGPTEFFDKGRIEVIGEGVKAEDVQVKTPGGISRDTPRN